MKTTDDILEFRLFGDGISPNTFTSKEVGIIMSSIETALKEYILINEPGTDIDTLFISPVSIQNQSLEISFSPNVKKYFITAFLAITAALNHNDISVLPLKTINSLKDVQKVIRVKNCNGEFKLNGKTKANISSDSNLDIPASAIIKGDTIIYGIVQRVGGVEPKAWIKISENKRLPIPLNEKKAKQLAHRLYSEVGFKGQATWLKGSRELIDFKVYEILDSYEPTSIVGAFDEIKGIVGKYWNKIDNINETLLKS